MIRRDPKYDPFRFVDDAVKRWRPEAFKERPYLAAVEYKVSLMGAGMLIVALAALMFGMAFAGPLKALAFPLIVAIAFRAVKPLVRAWLYDMEEAKRPAAEPGSEAQGAQVAEGQKKDDGPIETEYREKQ